MFLFTESSDVPLGASVDIVADHNMVANFEGVKDGSSGSATAGVCDGCMSIF